MNYNFFENLMKTMDYIVHDFFKNSTKTMDYRVGPLGSRIGKLK